ncbi:MAG TPA: NAD(P)-binding protein, partial [Mycobacteriales bacterium]|nr:NAD(P)-binding protein [Mycobacteriales bacterium]
RAARRDGRGVMDRPFAITLAVGSSRANHTGTWRTDRPVYVEHTPPCSHACPAGEDVRGWLHTAEDGSYERAWGQLVDTNPFPAVMGRVCYHPCESVCNRAEVDGHVGINAVERFLGDHAIAGGFALPPAGPSTGKRVLVVGAGPAGLAATYRLRRLGHAVTLADAEAEPGGMLRYGIPAYRLPRDVLDAEIARILAMDVTYVPNHRVDDLAAALAGDGFDAAFDAAFVAVGAQIGKRAYIPAGDSARVLDAVSVLHGTAEHDAPQLGHTVAVYGGGNTAFDAARTARRLGAAEAVVVYRRTRDRMPAHESELEDALAEGVRVRWLSTITHAEGGSLTVERMELDDDGFPQPTGEVEELGADTLLLALGQQADLGLVARLEGLTVVDDRIVVDATGMTGAEGVFAGGDATGGTSTVTEAIGHGLRAARAIDAWLWGEPRSGTAPVTDVIGVDRLNTWYFSEAPPSLQPVLDAARRASSFDEVVGGLDESTALYEARRCLSCGDCLECDNCYGVCPDNAVIKLGPGERYAIDLDFCKGCGLCVQECPAGAMEMVPEPP